MSLMHVPDTPRWLPLKGERQRDLCLPTLKYSTCYQILRVFSALYQGNKKGERGKKHILRTVLCTWDSLVCIKIFSSPHNLWTLLALRGFALSLILRSRNKTKECQVRTSPPEGGATSQTLPGLFDLSGPGKGRLISWPLLSGGDSAVGTSLSVISFDFPNSPTMLLLPIIMMPLSKETVRL